MQFNCFAAVSSLCLLVQQIACRPLSLSLSLSLSLIDIIYFFLNQEIFFVSMVEPTNLFIFLSSGSSLFLCHLCRFWKFYTYIFSLFFFLSFFLSFCFSFSSHSERIGG